MCQQRRAVYSRSVCFGFILDNGVTKMQNILGQNKLSDFSAQQPQPPTGRVPKMKLQRWIAPPCVLHDTARNLYLRCCRHTVSKKQCRIHCGVCRHTTAPGLRYRSAPKAVLQTCCRGSVSLHRGSNPSSVTVNDTVTGAIVPGE